MTMTFDQIEKALGKHCDTAKSVRDRVELMRDAAQHAEQDYVRKNGPDLGPKILELPKIERRY